LRPFLAPARLGRLQGVRCQEESPELHRRFAGPGVARAERERRTPPASVALGSERSPLWVEVEDLVRILCSGIARAQA
jgi:hypothetical protein